MDPNTFNPPTIEQLARGCRIAQKRYFADQCNANLIIAKTAEKLLDSALDQLASLRGSGLAGEEAG